MIQINDWSFGDMQSQIVNKTQKHTYDKKRKHVENGNEVSFSQSLVRLREVFPSTNRLLEVGTSPKTGGDDATVLWKQTLGSCLLQHWENKMRGKFEGKKQKLIPSGELT